ncbi:MAG TPA: UDP-glucose/GDP-mannose dehydrogenase family protein [Streptosporangiaceae bacterium]|nr:UDP-glucose/GDP-mannose dehydrogenase family protein [Streptosporangiaceae bacterium]
MNRREPSMRVTVVGVGHLGLTHAACMADLGHQVLAVDLNEPMIAKVANGEVPFFEPGLEPLLRRNLGAGRLVFSTSYEEAADFGEVHFLCVGTPEARDGAADLTQTYAAVRALAPRLRQRSLIVGKSTVPVGTARKLLALAKSLAPAGAQVGMAWNPEFLREGFAVTDSLSPDRLVFGITSERAATVLKRLYVKLLDNGIPSLVTDLETAELVKVAANAFLATRISFLNAVAEVCEATGADIVLLARALSYDPRIGSRYLSPGLGFGGSCLPKDIRAFQSTAKGLGIRSVVGLLGEVDTINLARRVRVVDLARQATGGSLDGKRVAALGVSFKPDIDDVRDSPSLDVCERLRSEGATVSVHDPMAMPNAAKVSPDLRYVQTVHEAAADADLVLHLTEWAEYQAVDPAVLGAVVAQRTLIDARCTLDAHRWRAAGWSVQVLGRPEHAR